MFFAADHSLGDDMGGQGVCACCEEAPGLRNYVNSATFWEQLIDCWIELSSDLKMQCTPLLKNQHTQVDH